MNATLIRTTDGMEGIREGSQIRWAGGGTTSILDDRFPPVKQGGKVVQRSLLVLTEYGQQGLIFLAKNN